MAQSLSERCGSCVENIRNVVQMSLQLVLALVLLMSTGLIAMTGIDIISKLAAQYAGGIKDDASDKVLRGFALLFACILVVETSAMFINCTTVLLRDAAFINGIFENLRKMVGLAPMISGETDADMVQKERRRIRAFDIGNVVALSVIAACFLAALGLAGWMVLVPGARDTDSGQSLGNAGFDVFVRASARNTVMTTTIAAYLCVFFAVALRGFYALLQILRWLFSYEFYEAVIAIKF